MIEVYQRQTASSWALRATVANGTFTAGNANRTVFGNSIWKRTVHVCCQWKSLFTSLLALTTTIPTLIQSNLDIGLDVPITSMDLDYFGRRAAIGAALADGSRGMVIVCDQNTTTMYTCTTPLQYSGYNSTAVKVREPVSRLMEVEHSWRQWLQLPPCDELRYMEFPWFISTLDSESHSMDIFGGFSSIGGIDRFTGKFLSVDAQETSLLLEPA